ncbi:portal protein [Hafnia phage Pocis76]|uniref:Portal protein n=1 Tax=Hafnia phage Pocis76 TaxID=2831174 RepID=A0A8E7FNR2_9CAUD|nr:portal protein [Hafnia phage Pocis76]
MNKIVKADGYNEIFNGGDRIEKPFYVTASTSLGTFYEQDGLAKRIIDVIPEDMVSAGFTVEGIKDDAAFRSVWDEKRLNAKIIDALSWSRLFGGAAIVAIVSDGRMLKAPAADGAKLEDIRVYDRYQVRIKKRETNPRSVRYGEPVIYTISTGGDVKDYDVHYTRVCIIDGERLPNEKRRQNDGWGAPILNKRLIEAIVDYNYCEDLATQLLRRKQQAVWKARGLADLCDDEEGFSAARLRLAQVDDNSGVGRAIGIDANDEEYDVLNSDINGVDAFLDKKMDRIVALTGIHEIVLRNKNTGGVSASQNTALETYHKLIERKRSEDLKPVLEFLLPFIIDEQEWSIVFNPLAVPSEKDQAEVLNKNVDSVTKLVADQIIDSDEARDTLRAIGSVLKLRKGDIINIPESDVEPEPEV